MAGESLKGYNLVRAEMTGGTRSPTPRFVLLSRLFNYVNVAEAAALCGLTLGARLGAVQASSALDPLGPMTPPRARRGSRMTLSMRAAADSMADPR